jgi:hypothetical protein
MQSASLSPWVSTQHRPQPGFVGSKPHLPPLCTDALLVKLSNPDHEGSSSRGTSMCAAIVTATAAACKRGYSSWVCTCARSGPLRGQHNLSWLKEGVQKHGSPTASGESPGTRQMMAFQPTSPTHTLPSHTLPQLTMPMAMVTTGGATCPQYLGPQPLLWGQKKKNIFFFKGREGCHL